MASYQREIRTGEAALVDSVPARSFIETLEQTLQPRPGTRERSHETWRSTEH